MTVPPDCGDDVASRAAVVLPQSGDGLSRRAFFLAILATVPAPIRAGAVVPPGHASLWRGLRFGAREAHHTASLLGRRFELVERASDITIRGPIVTITAGGRTFRISPNVKGKVAWLPTLTRFGAGELNERFLRETKHAMDDAAWLGWVAVKIVAEAGLRKREIAKVRIDGHKGVPLTFDANGQLVQPLYDALQGAPR